MKIAATLILSLSIALSQGNRYKTLYWEHTSVRSHVYTLSINTYKETAHLQGYEVNPQKYYKVQSGDTVRVKVKHDRNCCAGSWDYFEVDRRPVEGWNFLGDYDEYFIVK